MAEDIQKLQTSIEELQKEVRELREVVNMLIDIIVTMEGDEGAEPTLPYMDLDKGDRDQRFSM